MLVPFRSVIGNTLNTDFDTLKLNVISNEQVGRKELFGQRLRNLRFYIPVFASAIKQV
jgi:hypothetical protein